MAAIETNASAVSTGNQLHDDREVNLISVDRRRGGWITLPFMIGSHIGLTLAWSGLLSNLIVYLVQEFNIKSINAAQISNIVNGSASLFPIAGAILADSFMGNFTVVAISSIVSLLGLTLLMLTAIVPSLRPPNCQGALGACVLPSTLGYGVLYTAISISILGFGGTRFTLATMGADQFKSAKEHGTYFNWYFVGLYVAYGIGSTVIVYVQDNIGWDWGFGICVAANAIALLVFLLGKRYYHRVKPNGSPFTSLARVVVAAIRKRKVLLVSEATVYYYGCNTNSEVISSQSPSSTFRFLNRAALKAEGDTKEDGSISKPWQLCTVQQVEDLKAIIKLIPLWSSSMFLSVPIGMQSGLVVLEALTMDRQIGSFRIPAGSFLVTTAISVSISLVLIDRILFPAYQKLKQRPLTPLQRIGLGHVFNILGMALSAILESRRLHLAHSQNHLQDRPGSIVPMKALWLVGPLAVVGIGEAFHFPGNVALYYQEFPNSLKGTATAMISLLIGIAYYVTTAIIGHVRRATGWLPDDINKGRLDNVYWFLVVVGVINLGYFLTCAVFYKYQNLDKELSVDHDNQEEMRIVE